MLCLQTTFTAPSFYRRKAGCLDPHPPQLCPQDNGPGRKGREEDLWGTTDSGQGAPPREHTQCFFEKPPSRGLHGAAALTFPPRVRTAADNEEGATQPSVIYLEPWTDLQTAADGKTFWPSRPPAAPACRREDPPPPAPEFQLASLGRVSDSRSLSANVTLPSQAQPKLLWPPVLSRTGIPPTENASIKSTGSAGTY